MSNIQKAFANGKAYMPFFICGDPNMEATAAAVRSAVQNGADLIELNIPFSDPTAGDMQIQQANIRALEKGVTTDKIFDCIRDLRQDVTVPIIISGYANVVFSYGTERFLKNCADIGIDGLIIPDVPFEEQDEFLPMCQKYGIDLISMIAITSKERIHAIAKAATGFLYIMENPGGTTRELEWIIRQVRMVSDIPSAVCISDVDAPRFHETRELVDGVVQDALIVRMMATNPENIGSHVAKMKNALR